MDGNQTSTPEVGGMAKKPNSPLLIGAGIVVLVLVGFALARGMGEKEAEKPAPGDSEENTGTAAETPAAGLTGTAREAVSADTAMAPAKARTITVEGGNFYFKPNEIRVKKGEKIKIVFSGQGMPHDFVVDELAVRTPVIQSGSTATVEFTADKAGTFEYYCSVGQHRKNGMFGKLIVE